MRLKIKRKNGIITSVAFHAETDEEAVDLKNAVLAEGLSPAGVIAALDRDYEVDACRTHAPGDCDGTGPACVENR